MKKGIALETTVMFIAGIVFLVLVIFVLIYTGLYDMFLEQTSVLFCTFSVYARGTIMRVVETFLPYILAMITLLTILSAGAIKGLEKGKLLKNVAIGARSAVTLGATALITAFVFTAISGIPLFCTLNSIDTRGQQLDEFVELVGSRSIDTFNTFGGGSLNPLWGLDPNPRAFYTIYFDLEEEVDMSDVLNESYNKFSESWPFGHPSGEMNLHLYCGNNYKGDTIDDWENCKIQNGYLYISFLDKVPYDSEISYGSDLCNMNMISSSLLGIADRLRRYDFTVKEDSIILCVMGG